MKACGNGVLVPYSFNMFGSKSYQAGLIWVSSKWGQKYQIEFSNEDSAKIMHLHLYSRKFIFLNGWDVDRFYVETWSVVDSSWQARENMVSAS